MKQILTTILIIFCISCCKQTSLELISVGKTIWMKYNLNVKTFRNGDSIHCATDLEHWRQLCVEHITAYYMINNYIDSVGLLYNYWALMDEREIAPYGWHVTNIDEWETVINNDTMNLHNVCDIFDVNKLNIKKYAGIYEYEYKCYRSDENINVTSFWIKEDSLLCDVCVFGNIDGWSRVCDETCSIDSYNLWKFVYSDSDIYQSISMKKNDTLYASVGQGRFIRCVKDY